MGKMEVLAQFFAVNFFALIDSYISVQKSACGSNVFLLADLKLK